MYVYYVHGRCGAGAVDREVKCGAFTGSSSRPNPFYLLPCMCVSRR